MYENILFDITDKVATITLNRPEVYNALSGALIKEITKALETAGDDESVRVIVITASGDKAFCSGADLKAALTGTINTSLGKTLRDTYHPMIHAIRHIEKPIICRLNGVAAGAGMSLALACDMIIAQKEAYLSELFVGIGLMPDAGSMYFLPRIVGVQKAFELCSTGRKVYMEEALQLGLVTKVVAKEDLDNAVGEMVEIYKNSATKAIGFIKQVLNMSYKGTVEEILDYEASYQDKLGHTEDFAEGVMAFLQKRKANFKGK